MSTELDEMLFEILPGPDSEAGLLFGIGQEVSVDDGGFLPGDDDWEEEDESNPRRGGTSFGRDLLSGPTWGWNLHVNREDKSGALESLGRFKTAWRALHIRDTPGSILAIRYQMDRRVRRIYGRPRRFSAPPTNQILNGYVPITVDFRCVDSFTYDDEEQVLPLALSAGSSGGFTFPTTFPTTTEPVGLKQGSAVVGGDAPTYPVIRIDGPVINPSLETSAWILTLDTSIADGDYVEIDLRPWALTALLNGESSVGGFLGRRTYLSEMKLEPGVHQFTYRGGDSSGSSTCAVRWRNAWNSI